MARPTNLTPLQLLRQISRRGQEAHSRAGRLHLRQLRHPLQAGPRQGICARRRSGSKPRANVPKPAEIKRQLDLVCIGQEHAKKTLAVAVHNHYKRDSPGTVHPAAGGEEAALNRPARGGRDREKQHSADRADGFRQDPAGPHARASPGRAVRHCRRHHADRGRLRGRGRREHHPAPAPERRLRRETRPERHRLHRRDRQDRAQDRERLHHARRFRARACSRRC